MNLLICYKPITIPITYYFTTFYSIYLCICLYVLQHWSLFLQSKTLAGDNSVLFSPPSIVKHSLLEESTSLHSLVSAENTPENIKTYEDMDIETVISEKTKVQHGILTNPIPSHPVYEIYEPNQELPSNVFRDITNLENSRSFARLNADRLRTITSINELGCDSNLIAPKEVLANALADHIYKVTDQKLSTSRIDEITNKIINTNANKNNSEVEYQKENQWWPMEHKETGTEELFSNEYYMFTNSYVE